MRFTSQGRLSRSRCTGAQVVSIFHLMGFIGIATVSLQTVAPVSSLLPPPRIRVSPQELSPAGAGKAEERAGSQMTGQQVSNQHPIFKNLCGHQIISNLLWSNHFITLCSPIPKLGIFFPSLFNTSHWFSVWLYLLNTKWDWTVICLDLTIPYQTFMI